MRSMTKDFLRPFTSPTRYFEGQGELYSLLLSFDLEKKYIETIIHLVARELENSNRH